MLGGGYGVPNPTFAKPWWCSRPVGEPNTEGR